MSSGSASRKKGERPPARLLRTQEVSPWFEAELLIYAGEVLGRANLTLLAEEVGTYGIESYIETRTSWPCGVIGAGETPNNALT
jgi:hypothetical protein